MTEQEKQYISLLEKTGSDVHPPLEVVDIDGWQANYANGYSHRANSVLPLKDSSPEDFEKRVSDCENYYKSKNQPCIIKLTEASPEGLDVFLKDRGYKSESAADVMTVLSEDDVLTARMESIIEPEETGVIVTSKPDKQWLDSFFTFEKRTDPSTMEIAEKQFKLIEENDELSGIYCRIQILGKDVAVASAVIKDDIMFLLNVVVDENCRGKGYGKILVKEILETACNMGAENLCLQVVSDNSKAINLYKSFGFKYLYTYWYDVQTSAL